MKTLLLVLLFPLCFSFTSSANTPYDGAKLKAQTYARDEGLYRNSGRNIYLDKGSVIHVFMYEDGNLLLSGYPTTATDKNKFQFHLFTTGTNGDSYLFEANGSFEPTLNVEGSNEGKQNPVIAMRSESEIHQLDFPIVGPFTGSVIFTIKRSKAGAAANPISSATVKIAKTIHASVGTGFVYSTLRNPTNIRRVALLNSTDSTLLADNPRGNATLALMATVYPWGNRNSLMMPSRSILDRTGLVLGTTIASTAKNFKNLYLGLQFDIAIGGSLVAGADIAERQKIYGVDYQDFTFGESTFNGNVNTRLYKKVGVGFFFGVQVDSRIFARMFAANP